MLDAGDALVRDRTPATSSQGQTSIELMNRLGYDAAALGEGDLERLGVSTVLQRIQEAKFPILSANAFLTGTDQLVTQPYVIRELGGHQVAIIGLTGQAALPDVDIRDPVESARRVTQEVRDRADILILLSHAGLDLNRQVAGLVPELDLIISGGDGFTSTPESTAAGPIIVQADASSPAHAGRRVGVGVWTLSPQAKPVTQQWETIALTSAVASDPVMDAWAQEHP